MFYVQPAAGWTAEGLPKRPAGFMAARVSADRAMPYARFVSHLARLWEYNSCPEAQMKTWLARHLLALGNPGCHMWSKSAAALAAFDDGADGLKPYGRYGCLLSDAGLWLKTMWQQQPGVDEMGPMPHVGAKVLAADPYFQVLPDPNNSCQLYVKLNFNKIKATLNW
eukprot:gene2693-2993_t